jgi:hypothetical protein
MEGEIGEMMQQRFLPAFILSLFAGVIIASIAVWAFRQRLYWIGTLCVIAFLVDTFISNDMYAHWRS